VTLACDSGKVHANWVVQFPEERGELYERTAVLSAWVLLTNTVEAIYVAS
jgi:hypothetical protein